MVSLNYLFTEVTFHLTLNVSMPASVLTIIGIVSGVVTLTGGAIAGVLPLKKVNDKRLLKRVGLEGKDVVWMKDNKFMMSLHRDEELNDRKTVREGRELLPDKKSRKVAVKIISKSENADKELDILKALNHKNIVKYIDCDEILATLGPNLYIIMELCDYNLNTYMDDRKHLAMPTPVFRTISAQLLSGLRYIHENGIIHRDIKPDNILVMKDREFKFSDFGIAKKFPHATQTNRNTGSDGYRPQESYKPPVQWTRKADIFSLGIVLTQLISRGEHPFGNKPIHWTYYITTNQNLDFSHVDFPTSERDILISQLTTMLSWDPENRPSVADVQEQELFIPTPDDTGESIRLYINPRSAADAHYSHEHDECSADRQSHAKSD